MIVLRHVNSAEVDEALGVLGAEAPLALARGINRTLSNVRTVMTRAVAGALFVRQAFVRQRMKEVKATRRKLSAFLTASAKPIPLIEQGARGPEPSRGRGRGVTAKTPQGRYPHAFIATMRSGHRGVFERMGKPRLKIRELRSASVAAVFVHHERAGQARADEQLPKNIAHEVEHMLRTKVQRAIRRSAGI